MSTSIFTLLFPENPPNTQPWCDIDDAGKLLKAGVLSHSHCISASIKRTWLLSQSLRNFLEFSSCCLVQLQFLTKSFLKVYILYSLRRCLSYSTVNGLIVLWIYCVIPLIVLQFTEDYVLSLVYEWHGVLSKCFYVSSFFHLHDL